MSKPKLGKVYAEKMKHQFSEKRKDSGKNYSRSESKEILRNEFENLTISKHDNNINEG